MYPPDLFKFNIELTDISNMFYNTAIPVGVDVNPDLFSKLSNLRNVSSVWSNCIFDSRRYNAESVISDQPQFNFNQILAYNLKITNASGLFGVFIIDDKPRGLRLISSDLLQSSTNLNNISNMFYYCKYMVGNVPLFNSLAYPVLNSVTGYFTKDSANLNIQSKDELLITKSIERKRFLGIKLSPKWFGYRNLQLNIVSKNPNCTISNIEYVELK